MITDAERFIRDVEVEEFTSSGELEKYIEKLKKLDFENLIESELNNVSPYLDEWQSQLERENHIWGDVQKPIDLLTLFRKTPSLSGVLYYSNNTVVSENIFEPDPIKISHLTDRVLRQEIQKSLPSAKNLTFSFPRKYSFEGYLNSWGFVRIERKDSDGNGAAVALSVTTLDHRVMKLMRHFGFEHLGELYNQVWDFAVHDYIHHIALYTNPSFAIGKRSPMSLACENQKIDQWGEDMKDTFNYEYWAHSSHRLITLKLLSCDRIETIIEKAKNYFAEVQLFQKKLIEEKGKELAQAVGSYLTFIYLWPLRILIPPYGREIEKLQECINALEVDPIGDKIAYVMNAMQEGNVLNEKDPLQFMRLLKERERLQDNAKNEGIGAAISSLLLPEKLSIEPHSLSWFDLIRFKIDMIAQRGVYERWYHKQQILYQNHPISPHRAMLKFLHGLYETLDVFLEKKKELSNYELVGILA